MGCSCSAVCGRQLAKGTHERPCGEVAFVWGRLTRCVFARGGLRATACEGHARAVLRGGGVRMGQIKKVRICSGWLAGDSLRRARERPCGEVAFVRGQVNKVRICSGWLAGSSLRRARTSGPAEREERACAGRSCGPLRPSDAKKWSLRCFRPAERGIEVGLVSFMKEGLVRKFDCEAIGGPQPGGGEGPQFVPEHACASQAAARSCWTNTLCFER